MLRKIILVFRIPELRRKILLTLILLAVYRLGYHVYLPFIDQRALLEQRKDAENQPGGLDTFMQTISLFSASQLNSIFGLGIAPYITASIIFQLLGTVYPPLEALQKEGEAGQRKINEYTRYATVLVCVIQSYVWIRAGMGGMGHIILPEYDTWFHQLAATMTMTAGAVFLMWIGEQIDAYGIGNGISLLIMAGIIARMPDAGVQLLRPAFEHGIRLGTESGIDRFILLAVMFVVVVIWVVAITEGQRRIPDPKRQARPRPPRDGRPAAVAALAGQSGGRHADRVRLQHPGLPDVRLPANQRDGETRKLVLSGHVRAGRRVQLRPRLHLQHLLYLADLLVLLLLGGRHVQPEGYFRKPQRLRQLHSRVSTGARTAQFLEQVMTRITYLGAAFLAMVAVIPTLIAHWMDIPPMVASFYGGTGLLIVVSVALDLVQKIDSHLVMRNYPGLLDSDS